MIRDIRRKTTNMDEGLAILLDRADRIRTQQPRDKNKLYSLHEPDVQCISKGKAHKRYEFGQKVAVATTNRSNWIVASALMEGNPYDGHTLSETLTTVERVTGVAVADAYVDKGYRGHGYTGASGGRSVARWVREEVDLTPFAGSSVKLRFEYVTDGGVNIKGFAIDDRIAHAAKWQPEVPALVFFAKRDDVFRVDRDRVVVNVNLVGLITLDERGNFVADRLGTAAAVIPFALMRRDRAEVATQRTSP